MDIPQQVLSHHLAPLFLQGTFGIEKEGQRIDAAGNIVTTPHPTAFGNSIRHPYIQRDFAESQLELITPPQSTLTDTLRWLAAIHEVVLRALPDGEYISPFSMPLRLPPEADIQVAQFDSPEDVAYREHLVRSYGKYKQMISGVHFNFQLSDDFVRALRPAGADPVEHRNALYLKLAKNLLRHQWLLIYLLGASPLVEPAFYPTGQKLPDGPVRSLRVSRHGYVNRGSIHVSYASLQDYVRTLEDAVTSGQLIAEKEFYSPVRFRGAKRARDLLTHGIRYLEIRLFDLNPFAPYGIELADARLIHAFLLHMLWMDTTAGDQDIALGQRMAQETALQHPHAPSPYQDEGLQLLHNIQRMLQDLGADPDWIALIHTRQAQLHDPRTTLGGRLLLQLQNGGGDDNVHRFHALGASLARQYKTAAYQRPYALGAFDNMELSTQALLADAIELGLGIELLDENDQFLALSYGEHREYVKNGNMTAKDAYIAPLIMENKVVTKKVLERAGFNVPRSRQYRTLHAALADYPLHATRPIVIKPKTTNYGLGITIFKTGVPDLADYRQALEIALREDHEIMVEDYLAGTEYRFFVLGSQTLAVLLREPANVTGDGQHTIAELIAEKNHHPLRGDGVRTPLKKISLGDIEALQLKAQGLNRSSVPAKGQKVQLRENSNISTGGDSIDMTDQMHPSYKALAAGIADTLGAAVCGVDMIIADHTQPARPDPASWGIIEANFNPMMMMHIYPYKGQSRRLTRHVLAMLFPELELKIPSGLTN